MSVIVNAPPKVSLQVGDSLELIGNAYGGTEPYNYQWKFGESDVPSGNGGNTNHLKVNTATHSNAGLYKLTASDETDSAESSVVEVEMLDTLAIDTGDGPGNIPATYQAYEGSKLNIPLQIVGGKPPYRASLSVDGVWRPMVEISGNTFNADVASTAVFGKSFKVILKVEDSLGRSYSSREITTETLQTFALSWTIAPEVSVLSGDPILHEIVPRGIYTPPLKTRAISSNPTGKDFTPHSNSILVNSATNYYGNVYRIQVTDSNVPPRVAVSSNTSKITVGIGTFRYYSDTEKLPKKTETLVEGASGNFLVASVKGGVSPFKFGLKNAEGVSVVESTSQLIPIAQATMAKAGLYTAYARDSNEPPSELTLNPCELIVTPKSP